MIIPTNSQLADLLREFILATVQPYYYNRQPGTIGKWNGSSYDVNSPRGTGWVWVRIDQGEATSIYEAFNRRNLALSANDEVWVSTNVEGQAEIEGKRGTGQETSSGYDEFRDLTDTPASYSGQGSKVVSVKADETGLEFTTGGGGGASQLSDLSDVNTSTPTAGNILRADGTDWESVALSTYAAAASHNHAASDINSGTLTHERGGLEADVSAYDGLPVISGGSTSELKCNFAASAAPTVNEDTGDGYSVGSLWHDTTNDAAYVCLDASSGAAVWHQIDLSEFAASAITSGTLAHERGGLEADVSGYAGIVRILSGATSDLKCNWSASTAPTINDDTGDGYVVGSWWYDTTNEVLYTCFDNSSGAAVWVQIFLVADNVVINADVSNALEVAQAPTGDTYVQISAYLGDAYTRYRVADGSQSSPSLAGSGDEAGSDFYAYGLGSVWQRIAQILAIVEGVDSQLGARLVFKTASTTGGAAAERLRITGDGDVSIGNIASPQALLDVNGDIAFHELSADPSNPTEGSTIVWQSDGTDTGDDGDIYLKTTAGSTTQTIQLTDHSAGTLVGGGGTDEKASVSANDTTPGYLNGKLVAGTGITLTEGSDGGDETLTIAATGTGTATVDVTGAAGEALSERDFVYLDPSDDEWYKVDIDATSSVKISQIRGVVVESGGIANASTGDIRLIGVVTGFSALTAWDDVWASTSAGGYTQTRPTLTAGGAQQCLARIGYATSATAVYVEATPVRFLKRASLANNGTLTIEHYVDAQARARELRAFVSSTDTDTLVSHGTSNTSVPLKDRSPATYGSDQCSGGTASASTVYNATYNADKAFDDNNATYWNTSDAGGATGWIQYDFGSGVTKTVARVTIRARDDSYGPTHAPQNVDVKGSNDGAAWATVHSITGETGWAAGEQRTYTFDNTTAYRYWRVDVTANNGGTFVSIAEIEMKEVATWNNGDEYLAQSFVATGDAIGSVKLDLTKTGSPTGNLTLKIYTDSGGSPNSLVTNGTSGTVSASSAGADTEFTFSTAPTPSSSTTYWLRLETSDSYDEADYVSWDADSGAGYAGGTLKSYASSTWTDESVDGVFEVLGEETTYDEPCTVGRWSGGTRDLAARADDGSGADANTKSTFKNTSGATLDVTCQVELP